MIKQNYNVIGVMSGTSLDGVDLAHINFTFQDSTITFKIHEATTVPYSEEWVTTLKEAVNSTAEKLHRLNEDYTFLLGSIINGFCAENNIRSIDAVCSHGHTILHQPKNKITLQIGNKPALANFTQQTIVCDFRVQDVAMGGQGAPLVPIGDELLFSEYYFCLNLGGFSNISFSAKPQRKRLAFDICAVNTVLNHYANQLGLPYDDRGAIARAGSINTALLDELDDLLFYKLPYPKSLGFEFVKDTVLPLIDKYSISSEDKLATYTVHIARQLAYSIQYFNAQGSVLVTGGGAYNTYLIEKLQELLPELKVVIPEDKIIQYKEALIFALLGVMRLRGEKNVLSSVTGAPEDHCAGFIYTPY